MKNHIKRLKKRSNQYFLFRLKCVFVWCCWFSSNWLWAFSRTLKHLVQVDVPCSIEPRIEVLGRFWTKTGFYAPKCPRSVLATRYYSHASGINKRKKNKEERSWFCCCLTSLHITRGPFCLNETTIFMLISTANDSKNCAICIEKNFQFNVDNSKFHKFIPMSWCQYEWISIFTLSTNANHCITTVYWPMWWKGLFRFRIQSFGTHVKTMIESQWTFVTSSTRFFAKRQIQLPNLSTYLNLFDHLISIRACLSSDHKFHVETQGGIFIGESLLNYCCNEGKTNKSPI